MSITSKEFRAMGEGKKGRAYQALGRLKAGQMNKLEAKYAKYLDELKLSGEVLSWQFDAINLRLADGCFYKPDFLVLTKDMQLEIHETKGFMTDDAAVKIKVAASSFPFRFVLVKWIKGAWDYTDY